MDQPIDGMAPLDQVVKGLDLPTFSTQPSQISPVPDVSFGDEETLQPEISLDFPPKKPDATIERQAQQILLLDNRKSIDEVRYALRENLPISLSDDDSQKPIRQAFTLEAMKNLAARKDIPEDVKAIGKQLYTEAFQSPMGGISKEDFDEQLSRRYAEKLGTTVVAASNLLKRRDQDPESVQTFIDWGVEQTRKTDYLKKKLEQVEQEWKDLSGLEKTGAVAGNIAKQIFTFGLNETLNKENIIIKNQKDAFPGLVDYQKQELSKPFALLRGAGLRGTNLEENIWAFWVSDFETAKKGLDNIDKLPLVQKREFLEALTAGAQFSAAKENLFASLDILGGAASVNILAKTAKAVKNAGSVSQAVKELGSGVVEAYTGVRLNKAALQEEAGVVKGMVTASLEPNPTTKTFADHIGQSEAAASLGYAKMPLFREVPASFDSVADKAVSIFRPESLYTNVPETLVSAKDQRRLLQLAQDRQSSFFKMMDEMTGLNRATPEQVQVLAEKTLDDMRTVYSSVSDSVLDVGFAFEGKALPGTSVIPAETTLSNVNYVALRFGHPQGGLFDSAAGAKEFADNYLQLAKDVPEINQIGNKFYLEIRRPISEQGLVDVALQTKTSGFAYNNTLSAYWRRYGAGATTAIPESLASANLAVSGIQRTFSRLISPMVESLNRVKLNDIKEIEPIWEMGRNQLIAKTDGTVTKGRFYSTEEFVDRFQRLHNKLPSVDQIDVYNTYRQVSDAEYVLHQMTVYKEKATRGVLGLEAGKGAIKTEAAKVDSLPFNTDEFWRGAVVDEAGNIVQKFNHRSKEDVQAVVKELTDNGWSIYRAYNTGGMSLPDKSNVQFLVTRNEKTGAPTIDNIGYVGGGHIYYTHEWRLSQPIIDVTETNARLLSGEKTLFAIETEKQGKLIVERLEEARRLYNAKDRDAFIEFVADKMPAFKGDTLWTQFEKGLIDSTQKIVLTRAGQSAVDAAQLKKGVDFDTTVLEGSLAGIESQIKTKYMIERDIGKLYSLRADGDIISSLDEAKTLHPLETLRESLDYVMNESVKKDYATKAQTEFFSLFGDNLKVGKDEFFKNPSAYIANPPWSDNVTPNIKLAGDRFVSSYKEIIGYATPEQRLMSGAREAIHSWALDRLGSDSKAFQVVDEKLLPFVKDPTTYWRSLAFQTHMGLFNPVQMALQASSFVALAAIVGDLEVVRKSFTAHKLLLGMRLNTNEAIIESAVEKAVKMGWNEKHFREMTDFIRTYGADIVGKDVDALGNINQITIREGAISKALDAALFFYKKGEQFNHVTAYAAAFLEWRKANPTAKYTREVGEALLTRASDLSINQSKAMQAPWQKGWQSTITQFWGIEWRMRELFIDPASRLTPAEKSRLALVYATTFGAPSVVTLSAGVDAKQQIDTWLEKNNIKKEEQPWIHFAVDGAPAMVANMISAGTTGQPYLMDLSRYAPNPNALLQALDKDKSLWQVLGGAGGSKMVSLLQAADPLFGAVYYSVFGNNEEAEAFKPTQEDFIQLAREVASVNSIANMVNIMKTGDAYSKKGVKLEENVGLPTAIADFALGIKPESWNAGYRRFSEVSDIKKDYQKTQKEVRELYQKARNAYDRQDSETGDTFVRRAKLLIQVRNLPHRESFDAMMQGFNPQTLDQRSRDSFVRSYEKQRRIEEGNKKYREAEEKQNGR